MQAEIPTALPDVNAETHPYEVVQHLLDLTANFSLCAVPDRDRSGRAGLTPGHPEDFFGINGGYGLAVASDIRRFESVVRIPETGRTVWTDQRSGELAGRFHSRWLLGPSDLGWTPKVLPPPAIFDPWASQRFAMLDTEFDFGEGDGCKGYGIGRTYPVNLQGRPMLLAGGVGNLMQGMGRFHDHEGTFVLAGRIRELGFVGNISCRIVDNAGDLRTDREIPSLTAVQDPDPMATVLVFRGVKKDRTVRTTYGPPPGGDRVSLITPSQMRSVRYGFTSRGGRLRTGMQVGPVIAHMTAEVFFNLLAPPGTAAAPVPFTTRELYTFLDGKGQTVGTIRTGVVDGVSFDLKFPQAPKQKGVRFAGFGPIEGGTGVFEGVQGMLTVNSLIGIAPHALSLLHVLYLIDPQQRFRKGSSQNVPPPSATRQKDPFVALVKRLDEHSGQHRLWRAAFRRHSRSFGSAIADAYNRVLDIGDIPGRPIDPSRLQSIFASTVGPFDRTTFERYQGKAKGTFRTFELVSGRIVGSSDLYSVWDPKTIRQDGRYFKRITGSEHGFYPPNRLPDLGEARVDLLVNSYREDVGVTSWVSMYQHGRQERTSIAYKLPGRDEVLWIVKDISRDGRPIENDIFMASHEWKQVSEDRVAYPMVGIFFEVDMASGRIMIWGDQFWKALYVEEPSEH